MFQHFKCLAGQLNSVSRATYFPRATKLIGPVLKLRGPIKKGWEPQVVCGPQDADHRNITIIWSHCIRRIFLLFLFFAINTVYVLNHKSCHEPLLLPTSGLKSKVTIDRDFSCLKMSVGDTSLEKIHIHLQNYTVLHSTQSITRRFINFKLEVVDFKKPRTLFLKLILQIVLTALNVQN
jgi:hypothetical protein